MWLFLVLFLVTVFVLSNQKVEAAYTNGVQTVRIQAHRGYSGRYPENTLLAFEKAIEAGADQIELDVHLSADDVVFVMHNATVDHTTNGSGALREFSSAQIKALDAGGWRGPEFAGLKVPTLAEALACCQGRVRVNIELKVRELPVELAQLTIDKTAQLVDEYKMWNDVYFSSFSFAALVYTKKTYTQAAVGLLDWDLEATADRQPKVQEIGGAGWFAHPKLITPERVASAHQLGLVVVSGAGNENANRQTSVQSHLDAGVDFISSNYTAEVVQTLSDMGMRKV